MNFSKRWNFLPQVIIFPLQTPNLLNTYMCLISNSLCAHRFRWEELQTIEWKRLLYSCLNPRVWNCSPLLSCLTLSFRSLDAVSFWPSLCLVFQAPEWKGEPPEGRGPGGLSRSEAPSAPLTCKGTGPELSKQNETHLFMQTVLIFLLLPNHHASCSPFFFLLFFVCLFQTGICVNLFTTSDKTDSCHVSWWTLTRTHCSWPVLRDIAFSFPSIYGVNFSSVLLNFLNFHALELHFSLCSSLIYLPLHSACWERRCSFWSCFSHFLYLVSRPFVPCKSSPALSPSSEDCRQQCLCWCVFCLLFSARSISTLLVFCCISWLSPVIYLFLVFFALSLQPEISLCFISFYFFLKVPSVLASSPRIFVIFI